MQNPITQFRGWLARRWVLAAARRFALLNDHNVDITIEAVAVGNADSSAVGSVTWHAHYIDNHESLRHPCVVCQLTEAHAWIALRRKLEGRE